MELNLKYDKYHYKNDFLSSYDKPKLISQIKSMFNYCAPYEEEVLHKDICELNIAEITDMFTTVLETKNIGNVTKDISHLKAYLDYCNKLPNALLRREDIEAITKPYKGVRKWLEYIKPPKGTDYLITIDQLYSLENADKKIFTKQLLAFIWLLFIGLDEDEIRYKTEQEIKEWHSWYKPGLTIPTAIKEKISFLIEKASKETGLRRKSRTEGELRDYPYKQSPYFFKYTNGKPGKPMPIDTIHSYYKNIKNQLGKKSIAKLSIRNSGIIYFAKLLPLFREYQTNQTDF
ncbi:MAG: phage lytic cycle repressor MrpR family protein [Bacillota bacterium]